VLPPQKNQRGSGAEPTIATGEHDLRLCPEMERLFEELEADIDRAEERIWIETYIYRDDKLGRRFASHMARAARRGIDVRLLYDPFGSQQTPRGFFEELARQGIAPRPYRPLEVFALRGRWWPRAHSRIVLIDDAGYTGGAAWGDEWLPRHQGGLGWHELCVRVQGPCIEDLAQIFSRRWEEALGASPVGDYTSGDRYPDLEVISDSPRGERLLSRRFRERIARARERVWLENAYFFPPAGFLRDLYAAAARGVDVRIIVPGETDLPSIKRAARAEHAAWLAGGLQIFEYQPANLHAKFGVIDGDWATVGSLNLNITALRWANEDHLIVYDERFVARVAELFEQDLGACRALRPGELGRRPLHQILYERLTRDVLSLLELGRGAGL
jgi:cardiolipin synthase A/B